jgi:hypothetical protein
MMSNSKEAQKAHCKVKGAIISGVIKRSDTCMVCGDEAKTEAHHPDYLDPLQVVWLCKPCHSKLHKAIDPVKEWKITPARQAWLDYLHNGIKTNYQEYKQVKNG